MKEQELQAAQARLNEFKAKQRYAHLATLSAGGAPLSSYAPCLLKEEGVYVFLSQLSGHCKNLLSDNRAGVLLVGSEADARNPFARQRLSYECQARIVPPDDARYNETLDGLAELHGNTVDLLRQLPDFVLFCVVPKGGTYVEGFGKAFDLVGEGLSRLQHVDEQTVRSRH